MIKGERPLGSPPPALNDLHGYTQTYLVKSTEHHIGEDRFGNQTEAPREAFFRCGNWCYSGTFNLDFKYAFGDMSLKDIPAIIPALQRQQDSLSFLCNADKIPESSFFHKPLKEVEKARDFVISELTSNRIQNQLHRLKHEHEWIDDGENHVYFELVGNASSIFDEILFICSRVYSNDLVFVTVYFEGVIYVVIEDGEGVQPLLNVSFPDVSHDGEGVTLAMYDDDSISPNGPWIKLSIWQALQNCYGPGRTDAKEPMWHGLSSDCYVQSYCILNSTDGGDWREVMFRFGAWCYSGNVELVPKIFLEDLPYVIPALRVQQKKLKFVSDINSLPSTNKFFAPLEYASKSLLYMETEAAGAEGYLRNLVSKEHGNRKHWLESDQNITNSFFEFNCIHDRDLKEKLQDVELITTKSYNPNGVVSIAVYHDGCWYLTVNEGNDHPLLDSKFPDISTKGQGYHIQSYPRGLQHWRQLRKVSVWRASRVEENMQAPDGNDGNQVDEKSSSSNDDSTDDISTHSIETEPSVDIDESKKIDPEQISPENCTELIVKLEHCTNEGVSPHYNDITYSDSESGTNPKSSDESDITLAEQDRVDQEDVSNEDHDWVGADCGIEEGVSVNRRRKRIIGVKNSKRGVQELPYSSKLAMTEKSTIISGPQNLGAFHHLAPLKKSGNSAVKKKLGALRKIQHENSVPWHKNGQPVGH